MRSFAAGTLMVSTLSGSLAFADASGSRLYITTAECAATPSSSACTSVGTLCVTRADGRITGTVERLSTPQRRNKIPAGLRFELSSADLKGKFVAAYPTNDRCKNLREFPANGSLGGDGAYIELSYPYRSLDLQTCELSGEPTPTTTRFYAVTNGARCGTSAGSLELPCASGPQRYAVSIIDDESGHFRGLALVSDADGARTVLSAATLERSAPRGTGGGVPILSWRDEQGRVQGVVPEAFLEAACGGKPAGDKSQVVDQIRKAAEDWWRSYVAEKCKSDQKSCEKKLKIAAGHGIRG